MQVSKEIFKNVYLGMEAIVIRIVGDDLRGRNFLNFYIKVASLKEGVP